MTRWWDEGGTETKHFTHNPRRITDAQLNKLKTTLAELGDLGCIVHSVDTDEIISGNQRVKSMNLYGATPTITERFDPPTDTGTVALGYIEHAGERFAYRAVKWTPAQCQRANIVANAAGGSWDWDILRDKFPADLLANSGLDADALAAMQTDADALGKMLAVEPVAETAEDETLVDRAEELQAKWQCAKGDIFKAGEHFFICGDCRDADTWSRLLKAAQVEKVNGVFTSPPYAEQRKKQYGGTATDKYVEWWEAVQANVHANLSADGSFFVNIKPHCEAGERVLYVFDLVLAMKRQWGWRFVDEFCWRDTRNGYPGKYPNRFKDAFEPVYHFCANEQMKFRGDSVSLDIEPQRQRFHQGVGGQSTGVSYKVVDTATASNVIEAASEAAMISHVAPFPVALPSFFVKAYSDAGDVWLDPFLGSGTTIVAAHKEGRRGLGIEMLEKYCAVICERLTGIGLTCERIASAA